MTCNSPRTWTGCYQGNYDLITPDSFAHPAKCSITLCFRILDHLKELGLLKDGDCVLDPLSGTGITAICANARGYKAITVELEPFFKDLQGDCQCQGVTERLFKRMMKGKRTRRLSYIGTRICPQCQIEVDKRWQKNGKRTIFRSEPHFYGGNKEYAGRRLHRELDWEIIQGDSRRLSELLKERGLIAVTSPPFGDMNHPTNYLGVQKRESCSEYSDNPANIGNLVDRPLKTVLSPPYDGEPGHKGNDLSGIRSDKHLLPEYGTSDGQIGQEKDQSYLEAMSQVYAEIARVSDVLALDLKNPPRNGKLRMLNEDTEKLLIAGGWTIHCLHEARLFAEHTTQDLFGEQHTKVKGRMSFFKRLSWQKGSVVADHEDIIIATRNGGGSLKTITSPPYAEAQTGGISAAKRGYGHYNVTTRMPGSIYAPSEHGTTPGQIGNLRDR